jgi:hypothetical protein
MTTDSWRVRVFVSGARLVGLGPDHARHAPYKRGEGVSVESQMPRY